MCPQANFNSPDFVGNSGFKKPLRSIFADLKAPDRNAQKIDWIDNFFRRQFISLFRELDDGFLVIDDPLDRSVFGLANSDLHCRIVIYDLNTYRKIALGGSNGSAQAYIDGLWSCDNPTALVRILLRNQKVLDQMESGLAKFAQLLLLGWHALQRNTKAGSKKNIAAHYDLGNEFFRLFLDQRMMYSSALYKSGDNLHIASDRKLQRICDVLAISADDNVIEIGSGWGGFACYAAANTGCKITTVTISKEQYNEATLQVKKQGLQDRVTVKLLDYRDIEGQFDKLVSIEMIEAVGHQYLGGYFKQINAALKPNGKALIQSIVIEEERYHKALKEVDYIKRYIFPGSFIPSYQVITEAAAGSKLMLEDLYDMGTSYAQTLRDWRKRFYQNSRRITDQGYDSSFKRMWEFYLCYCEGGFEERTISVGQLVFQKPQ